MFFSRLFYRRSGVSNPLIRFAGYPSFESAVNVQLRNCFMVNFAQLFDNPALVEGKVSGYTGFSPDG
ncbi:hypothetical protein A6M21_12880 [Desulfotomaculum copahuensis]|uniref:Uncharacterized protein n=1 Tax=Desulfotomaculum copahuensis TaxID=1838280 RepID=A0A1B7LCU2_9FIRM|nr:hypothetical protein A6M21_12880 [Desulfotomaculum copahuensis]